MRRKRKFTWIGLLLAVSIGMISACSNSTEEPLAQTEQVQSQQVEQRQEASVQSDDASQLQAVAQNQETSSREDGHQADIMEVHFIDVGQGDATLIKCGGYYMLIDTAEEDKGTAIQNYLQKQGIEKLDYLVLTHPDSDHIGSAPVILGKFEIGQVLVSNYEKDNAVYRKLMQALDDKGLTPVVPELGSEFALGSAVCTVLAPCQEYDSPNNASIALLVRNGDTSFLFTGDAEEEAEQDMLKSGADLEADVYKAGHHGSKTSSSEEFLDAVHPKIAVISCGEGNSYGHPSAGTLNNLRARGIKVYRTDEQGSIVATSDGKEITWNAAPSETWQAGEPQGSSTAQQTGKPQNSITQQGTSQSPQVQAEQPVTENKTYVLNTNTMKFHETSCKKLPTANRQDTTMSRDEVLAAGYDPCGICKP